MSGGTATALHWVENEGGSLREAVLMGSSEGLEGCFGLGSG